MHETDVTESSTGLVHVQPRWVIRREPPSRPVVVSRKVRRWVDDFSDLERDSDFLAAVEQIAASLSRHGDDPASDQSSCSLALTSTGPDDRQALTAIALGSVWARWRCPTIIVELGGSRGELGRLIRSTRPTLTDIVVALEMGHDLPAPQPISSTTDNLECVASLGRYSLARIADTGLLPRLHRALARRYRRIIWNLPPIDRTWSSSMFDSCADAFVVSLRRGRSTVAPLRRLAAQLRDDTIRAAADSRHAPSLQVIWHQ